MLKFLVFSLFFSIGLLAHAQSCTGLWITIDDATGYKKSIVELYKKEGVLYGKVVYIYKRGKDGPNSKCTECSGKLYNQPILGMLIAKQLKWNGSEWEGGTILDPDNGKTYTCSMWLNENNHDKLNVRGYIGPFYRTQEWIRTDKIPTD
ncbi:MAG: DUF2147 domain-containing protein [Flavobacteriia bacterium]|jgi:uncharacterized protein (DUF2147 family)|nr:DUF2147 domain-containing protein [Cryomorphaceae bacterium]